MALLYLFLNFLSSGFMSYSEGCLFEFSSTTLVNLLKCIQLGNVQF